jgi:hypothetical protein
MNSPAARIGGKFTLTGEGFFLAANAGFRDLSLFGKSTVDGKGAGAPDHNGQSDGERKKVILNAFALLIASPVCEKAEVPMDHGYGHHHIASNAKSGNATEKAKNQADAAEEFGADGQKCEGGGDVRLLGEEGHGGGESVAAKPAERLLRAVREEDHAKNEAKNGEGHIVGGVDDLAEHENASLSVEEKMGLHETEMLHRFRRVKDSKAADGGGRRGKR